MARSSEAQEWRSSWMLQWPRPARLQIRRHGTAEGLGIERGADRGGEHEVGLVPPDPSRRALSPAVPVRLERLHDGSTGAGCGCSGSLEISQEDTLPAVAQQLPSDPDERHRVLELQVVPGDPEQLTSPQAEGERHHVGGLQALALHFAQEGLGLLWRQRSVPHAVGSSRRRRWRPGFETGSLPARPGEGPAAGRLGRSGGSRGHTPALRGSRAFAHVGGGELVEFHGADGGRVT